MQVRIPVLYLTADDVCDVCDACDASVFVGRCSYVAPIFRKRLSCSIQFIFRALALIFNKIARST
jgi:hypothetical protein